jgi:hypothetical protein
MGIVATGWTILLPILTVALLALTMLETPDEVVLQG